MNNSKPLKTDWIAIFEQDSVCKIFETPGKSDEVAYWIRRFEDGRTIRPVTTNSIHQLRSFEILDPLLVPTSLEAFDGGWKCTKVTEYYLNRPGGSNCEWVIEDNANISKSIKATGNLGNGSGRIREVLDFTALMFLLKWFSKYKSWNELEKKEPDLYYHFTKHCVPVSLFSFIEKKTNDFYFENLTTEILLESIVKS